MSADADPLVDRLAALLCDDCDPGPCHDSISEAGRVLKFLANAGRLLPEGGQTRTEWGVRSTGDYAVDCTDADEAHRWAARDVRILCERGRDATLIRRSVQEWPDGSTLTGPWVAVDQEATDA